MTSIDERERTGDRAWFARGVLDVARDLLGASISTTGPDGRVTIRITEVEAYAGSDDPGSHAFRGQTARNRSMFGEAGHLYVYRHLGLHRCVNVVTGPAGSPAAVLIRAGEVVDGAEVAWARREASGRVASVRQLARGPARLAVCLGLGLDSDGVDVARPDGAVVVEAPDRRPAGAVVMTGPRVGVFGEGGDGQRFPWRLWLAAEPTVSDYRRSYRPSAQRPR